MAEAVPDVATSFYCQGCLEPLKLDPTLSPSDLLETSVMKPENRGAIKNPVTFPQPAFSRQVTATEDEARSASTWHLFDILSDGFYGSEIDHPLCVDCTDTLLDRLDARLQEVEESSKGCAQFLTNMKQAANEFAADEIAEEIASLEKEELELRQQLKACAVEEQELAEKRKSHAEKMVDFANREADHWKERNSFQQELDDYLSEDTSTRYRTQLASRQLERLKKTNVFNDAFHIWHDGHFGTINSFRLGRLPSIPVEWAEINAAWGQAVLLLQTMALRLGLTFSRYRLVPNGSQSRLDSIDDKMRQMHLHHDSGGFGIFSGGSKQYDQAMIGFLDCLQQFKSHVESRDVHFKLPYRINRDTIGDSNGELSIKLQLNHEETWTKALKFMLTNLKWCLAWVCKLAPQ